MSEPAAPAPEDAVTAAIAGMAEDGRKLVARMWTRPRSKPLCLIGAAMRGTAAELEAAGVALVEAGADERQVVVLTRLGAEVARALRALGPRAPAPPLAKPTLTLLRAETEPKSVARPPEAGEGGARRGPPRAARTPGDIWPGCPVQALGVHGKLFFYLDVLGQLHSVDNHTKDRMRGLFGGRSEMLMAQWPSFSKGDDGKVTGWKQEDAAAAMQRACGEKGVWNAFERVRGLGAWPDGEGGVALHCGDAVLYRGTWRGPGEIEGFVYPSAPRIPRPLEDRLAVGEPASELLTLLDTWAWVRGDLDAYLLLGWICGAMFGGAIDWRPLVWITGDKGTGKSTVQKVIRHVMGGEGAILQSTDATEASIRQFLMQSTIPVALDELEADADNRRSLAVIKLARQAASGGVVLRGGADHTGQEFRARSAFAFSSILVPPLLDQDISRIALLELMPLTRGETSPAIDPRRWSRVGRALRARVLDQWPRLAATLELYRQALHAAGHDARGCDQFGTLLAMADVAMHATLPDPGRCDQWAARLSAEAITGQTDQSSDWQRMLNHLFGQHLDVYRGGDRHTVGWWVLAAAGYNEDMPTPKAKAALTACGLRLEGRGDKATLTVANAHPGLAALFMGTHWHAGGGQKGVWAQAAKRIPGVLATGPVRFDGVLSRGWAFGIASVANFFDEAGPSAEQAGAVLIDAGVEAAAASFGPDDFA